MRNPILQRKHQAAGDGWSDGIQTQPGRISDLTLLNRSENGQESPNGPFRHVTGIGQEWIAGQLGLKSAANTSQ